MKSCIFLLINSLLQTAANTITFHVPEEQPVHTKVGKLQKNPNSHVTLLLHEKDFSVDKTSGIIYTKKVFDREKLSRNERRNGIRLIFDVDSQTVKAIVNITDINDNIPYFQNLVSYFTISEDVAINHSIKIEEAVDKDIGTNAITLYRIISGDKFNNFKLVKNRNGLYLQIIKNLDREQQAENVLLNITTCDKLSNLCNFGFINITIADVNDNKPTFSKNTYNADVYENVTIGATILFVHASDADKGSNANIIYTIQPQHTHFTINSRSGAVILQQSLDYEFRRRYTIIVVAANVHPSVYKTTATVVVTVLDCNDNAPDISFTYSLSGVYNVMENEKIGTKVGTVVVSDRDADLQSNQVTLTLTNTNQAFKLEKDLSKQGVYSLCVNKGIDREKTQRYFVNLTAIDNGSPPLLTIRQVILNVGDVNDNAPTFPQKLYKASVNDSTPVGSIILTVLASDLDIGPNRKLTYEITNDSSNGFLSINKTTGDIYIRRPLDPKAMQTIRLDISARDHGSPVLVGNTSVVVTLIDSNDNDPYFDPYIMNFNVSENNKRDISIGKVTARDRDIVGSSEIVYKLNDTSFYIVSTTGVISARRVFDREKKAYYYLTVTATDGGGRQGNGLVVIRIIDVNDCSPKFEKTFLNLSIHENFPINNVVAYVKAVDEDEGSNARLIYSARFQKDVFAINRTSGGVILKKSLLKLTDRKYNFKVEVEDAFGLKGQNVAQVVLNVLPKNTKAPIFQQKSYHFALSENNKKHEIIGKVSANRPVSGSIAFIKYLIIDGNTNNPFSINRNGEVSANRVLDYERRHIYTLRIQAVDLLDRTLTSIAIVRISVRDENDNKPIFISTKKRIDVEEGVSIGHILYVCKAYDRDQGDSNRIVYSIFNTTGPFKINNITGEVTTIGSLDYEAVQSYWMVLQAADGGTPVLVSHIKLKVRVLDINDNPPIFDKASYVIHVKESLKVGTVITTLNASDPDSGKNGTFHFLLSPSLDAKTFFCDKDGVLSLKEAVDRERKDAYEINFAVQDEGVPPQRSEATMKIIVDDVNDEIPKFEKSSYFFELREELPAGTEVGQVIAHDADIGDNGQFTYSMLNDNGLFRITTRKGTTAKEHSVCVITSSRPFDSETDQNSFTVTIVAKDRGHPANENQVVVQIEIKNINDHRPKFSQGLPYLSCLVEGTNKNAFVTKVGAADLDAVQLRLKYSLVALVDEDKAGLSLFRINPTNGSVYTKTKILPSHKRIYEVTVSVMEIGTDSPMFNYQKLIVFVVPYKSRTIFNENCVQAAVKESRRPKHGSITTAFPYDSSYVIGSYKIDQATNPNRQFSVLKTTGLIMLDLDLDYGIRSYYQLKVTAKGEKNGKTHKDYIVVNIFVIPTNHDAPSYPNNPERYAISEDSKPSTVFTTLKLATDNDDGMESTFMYSIAEASPADAPIKITPINREIIFTESIDREQIEQFVLKVRITDLALDVAARHSQTFTIYLVVKDVNDNRPVFVSSNQSKVMEDAAVGTFVTTIKAEDPDRGSTKTSIVYEILSGNEDQIFQLNSFQGHLKTQKNLDIYRRKQYKLVIIAKEYRDPASAKKIPSLNSTVDVIIDVVDVNNNKPQFTKKEYVVNVMENKPAGSFVIQLNSTDADINPEYKKPYYELLVGYGLFDIDTNTGVLTTKITFDRETVPSYNLTASVSNFASNDKTTCLIVVNVDDENDHAPIFVPDGSIMLHVLENSKPTFLHKFLVKDNDIGTNAEVEYAISKFYGDDTFHLDSKTGKLSVLKRLDREAIDKYEFQVEVHNTSPPKQRVQQNVTVIVDDVNDEKPVFQQKSYIKNMRENKVANMSVVQVKAIDKDSGTNANIRYTLLGDGDGYFSVNPHTGEVFLLKELDYEKTKLYHLKVKATGPENKFSDMANVTVRVIDQNDNSPVFESGVYAVTVSNIAMTPVVTVTATDADEDGKQKVTYYIDPPSREFAINKRTGAIRIINPTLTQGQYRLHVKAQDVGFSQHKTFVPVFITIGNPNKTVLSFLNKSVVFSLQENPAPNTQLGRIVAVSTLNKSIWYQIVEGSNPGHAFAITSTGELYVNNSAAVDYETNSGFFLGVLATTRDVSSSISSFLNVLINLTDVNDNFPSIHPKDTTFEYPETNEKDLQATIMAKFIISDNDKLDKDKLKLEIISGNDNKVFGIRHNYLARMKNIDYEQQKKYHLVIRVTDTANHWDDSKIEIVVQDQNDNPPILPKLKPIHVSEASPVGTVITTITAVDVDTTKSEIKYSLECLRCHSVFNIDSQLGTLTLSERLDYERRTRYVLNISAFDTVHRSYTELRIKVDDSNDNSPQFNRAEYSVNVTNFLKMHTYITKVTATDLDSTWYGHVQYKVDPPKDAFTIEQETGIIFTNKDFTFPSEVKTFKLGVLAYDFLGRNGSKSSTATVLLSISGKKAINLVFGRSVYYLTISEGATIGSHVDKVLATPSDVYQPIQYRILGKGNDGDVFSIGVYSGEIKVNNPLDREKKDGYTLEIIATAHDLNISGKCVARIKIEDANDNSPYFLKNSYNISVKEDVNIGSSLIQLTAYDSDDPTTGNAKIKYEIHSGQDLFGWLSIDPDTGWVSTAKELDRETTSQIKLTIKAADREGLGRKTFVSLNVTVLDVNDETPQFKVQVQVPLKIKENLPPNSMALKVNAVDKDEGSNGLVNYRIINGTGVSKFHMKDATSGWVYTTKSLDYEQVRVYSLSVLAIDNGKPPRSASFEYQITVEDVNEYQPEFLKQTYEFKIPASLKVGSEIGRVNATDKDGGTAGIVRYLISSINIEEFSVNQTSGVIVVMKDLRRNRESKRNRRSVDDQPFSFKVLADNGPNTTASSTEISVAVNFTCPGCARITTEIMHAPKSATISTLVIVASVSVFVLVLFLLCVVVYCRRKRTCLQQTNQSPFCKPKKDNLGPSSSVERELLHSNASSFDPLQPPFFSSYNNKPETQTSSDTGGLVPESGNTVRSVSATDKASTYSFGIYHEQAIPESEIRPFSDTLSSMSLKDLEQDSVFAYPSTKIKKKPTRSCVSRSTQQSSLYSISSSQAVTSFTRPPAQKQSKITERASSHESLKDFREEGGGEAASGIDVGNLLYVKLAEVDAEEQDAVMDGVRPFQEEGVLSHGDSLSTIIGSEDDLRGNYDYKYMNNWGPQFNPVNSVFSEIGRTNKLATHSIPEHTVLNTTDNRYNNCTRDQNIPNHPDEIPLQVLKSGRTSMLSSVPSLPRTPQEIPSAYTSGALSPNFTPALTPLVFRSPSVSSVGTQENYGSHSPGAGGFKIGLTSPLHRTESMITLSDIDVSDEEV